SEPIFDHVVGIILVFSQIIPCSAFDFFPVHGKQLRPWIFSRCPQTAPHHRCHSSECNPVSAIARGDELPFGVLSDIRQAIRSGNNLPRPAMIYMRLGDDLFQSLPQSDIGLLGLLLLSGLMIFTTVDDVIEPVMSIDSQIVVRITCVPEKRFWN